MTKSAGLGDDLLAEAAGTSCNVCGQAGLLGFYTQSSAPSQTCVLLDSQDEAVAYPTGEILLALCRFCGFIQNIRFSPELVDYSLPTEESQAFSPKFSEFAEGLADRLVDEYALVGKSVLEVGCGKGDFLFLLADRGIGSALGIDPGFLPNRPERVGDQVVFERNWYDADSTQLTADLVVTRHLMEHISNVGEFLGWLIQSTAKTPGAAMFTEVPDTERVLAEGAFWDVYYEHCSYYTRSTLAAALELAGFEVDWVEYGFERQYLLSSARPSGGSPVTSDPYSHVEELTNEVERFGETARAQIEHWRGVITDVAEAGGNVAVWGGGSKAVAFVSAVGHHDLSVVDINPHKQGKWLPAVGVEVRPPESLAAVRPDLVVAMNPAYLSEIGLALEAISPGARLVAV